jgi:DNA-binding winged helix-turn-helix (wHTH) protein
METTPVQRVVRFGAFEVDLRSRELRKHGLRIRLQEQPFRVLELLLEHPGELITREELQRQIWSADTLVDFELGLNTAIKRLRQALGDSAENPHFVETLPRREYRFVFPINIDSPPLNGPAGQRPAAITHLGVESGETPLQVGHWPRWIAAGLPILLLALLSAGGYLAARHRRTVAPDVMIHSIAVLPLENLSADPQQEYFADGMTDES